MNDEELRQHAYLIARGVRPLAIAGNCPYEDRVAFETIAKLEELGCPRAIPFIVPRSDGMADFGYASTSWAIDLLRWVESDAVPANHRHRIIGLLLGYDAGAILEFEEQNSGRLLSVPGGAA